MLSKFPFYFSPHFLLPIFIVQCIIANKIINPNTVTHEIDANNNAKNIKSNGTHMIDVNNKNMKAANLVIIFSPFCRKFYKDFLLCNLLYILEILLVQ